MSYGSVYYWVYNNKDTCQSGIFHVLFLLVLKVLFCFEIIVSSMSWITWVLEGTVDSRYSGRHLQWTYGIQWMICWDTFCILLSNLIPLIVDVWPIVDVLLATKGSTITRIYCTCFSRLLHEGSLYVFLGLLIYRISILMFLTRE